MLTSSSSYGVCNCLIMFLQSAKNIGFYGFQSDRVADGIRIVTCVTLRTTDNVTRHTNHCQYDGFFRVSIIEINKTCILKTD